MNMANKIHKVFVYGTLKKGEPNHHWLTDIKNGAANFVSRATTNDKYPLVIATRYNIPFLLDKPGEGYNVSGEIYEVDDKMLSNLDVLEDHPNLYVRELADVSSDESRHSCWIYLLKTFPPALLSALFLENYTNKPPNPLYAPRSSRTIDIKDDLDYKLVV
ncbi:putative gamma-glutamylcyclotransferase CG2811 [Ctenocephalides felis]|uniref:putative gamma-glutamylcyclotransferase CG2811 n=1 Tax=Ctenocephalides felis TaxID=7515 RepID=UPI000E6E1400|nr:putative gamma-glutamylcyclotransferase CG2811 [Ctenocephalides felis]